MGKDDDVSGDEVMLEIPRDSSSEEEMEDQNGENGLEGGPNEGADNGRVAVNDSNFISSNHVSSLVEPSSMMDEDSSRRNPALVNIQSALGQNQPAAASIGVEGNVQSESEPQAQRESKAKPPPEKMVKTRRQKEEDAKQLKN